MRKVFISAALIVGMSLAAQTSQELLKAQINALKVENAELTQQNTYFKQTLELLKPLATNEADGLQFNILKLVGSKKNKTLKVHYSYTNTQSQKRDSFQPSSAHIVDLQGNQFLTYNVYAGADQTRVEDIPPGIPMKGVLVFSLDQGENLDFPMIKILTIKFITMNSIKTFSIDFRNLNVVWSE